MRRRISLFVLAFLMVVPAVAPVRAAKPVPTDPPVAAADPQATPEPTPEATPDPTPERTPEATPDPAEPIESAPPESSPGPESSGPLAVEPTLSPEATPAEKGPDAPPALVDQNPAKGGDDSHGRPDVTGRYIVLLDAGTDTSATVERMGRQKGIKADRTFGKTIRGFSARLDAKQRKALEADPSVVAVVPDEVIQVEGQTTPTGVSRVFTKSNTIAKINGVDERVDADVAIVDTGIQPNHPDLNVVGGYNCSTSNRAAWRDVQNHGTHVAGTVAAKDNTIGVVGVAPGARLWAVKILNDDGYGLLSWYVCGLDWILAQRDPADPSRPLMEAANMSVAKSGDDDPDCGASERDILHLAICRVVKGGVTVVAAAGNDQMSAAKWVPAAYNEVITVSALADTDGKPGGLGGHRCFSWGSYDSDDTYANFSNYGSDIDIMAPGKCIWSTKPGSTYGYMSGTSMATPAVTGAAALYKASRPKATPAEVREALQYLGNLNWKTYTDPDSYHERLLDVSKLGPLGTFSLGAPTVGVVPETGGAASVGIAINRSSTFFERVRLSVSGVPAGWTAHLDRTTVFGWSAKSARLNVTAPPSVAAGTYEFTITGTNQGRSASTVAEVTVGRDLPTALAPTSARVKTNVALNASSAPTVVSWPAASDLSSSIAGYESQWSRDGGAWTGTVATSATARTVVRNLAFNSSYQFRVRARDAAGNWSTWAATSVPYRVTHTSDRSPSVRYSSSWKGAGSTAATSDTLMSTNRAGAVARYTFTGKGIALVMPRSPSRAWVEVRIDGTYVGKFNLWASSLKARQTVFSRAWLTTATRTIELRTVTSSSRKLVSLDAFVVTR
jgi:subtilisin family serine protease